MKDYIKYQESTGSVVKIVTIPTTKEQEEQIKKRAEDIGDPRGLSCARSVSAALGGVCGIPKTRFPGNLYDEAKKAKASCESKK